MIGDGWHHGPTADSHRAFEDSLVGLSSGSDPISFLGIKSASDGSAFVVRPAGGMTGESWAKALLALGELSVVTGHPGSTVTNAAARVYAENGVPLIVPNATARAEPEVEHWVFRLLPEDDVQGRFLAEYALDSLKSSRVSVVFAGDAFGVSILNGVRAAFAARGVRIADEVELPVAVCQVRELTAPQLATRAMMQRARPDVIIVALPLEPANCVISEALRLQPSTVILGADALDALFFDRWARNHVPGAPIRIATGWLPRDDSLTTRYVEAFARRTGTRPRGGDALRYDALTLAAMAIRETDGSPQQVRNWLASLGGSREPVLGLTGALSFAEKRDVRLYVRPVQ